MFRVPKLSFCINKVVWLKEVARTLPSASVVETTPVVVVRVSLVISFVVRPDIL